MTTIEESSVDTMALVEYYGYEIADKPADHDENLRQVQAHISWENEEMALAIINEMLLSEPNNQNLLAYKAYLLYMTDQISEALLLCDQILKETNGIGVFSEEYKIPKGFIQAVKASSVMEEETMELALQFINQAIQQERHPFYFGMRAMINLTLNHIDQVIKDATFVIENFKGYSIFEPNPNDLIAEMYAARAFAKYMQDQPWQDDYQEALNRASDLLEALF